MSGMAENAEAVQAAVDAVMASRHLRSEGSQRWARQAVVVALSAAAPLIAAAERGRADGLQKDYRALVAEVVAGVSSTQHAMTTEAGLPCCCCGFSLAGGRASEAFITHALADWAGDSPVSTPGGSNG